MEKQLCKHVLDLLMEVYRLRDVVAVAKKLVLLPDDPDIGYDPFGDLVEALRNAGEIPEEAREVS